MADIQNLSIIDLNLNGVVYKQVAYTIILAANENITYLLPDFFQGLKCVRDITILSWAGDVEASFNWTDSIGDPNNAAIPPGPPSDPTIIDFNYRYGHMTPHWSVAGEDSVNFQADPDHAGNISIIAVGTMEPCPEKQAPKDPGDDDDTE